MASERIKDLLAGVVGVLGFALSLGFSLAVRLGILKQPGTGREGPAAPARPPAPAAAAPAPAVTAPAAAPGVPADQDASGTAKLDLGPAGRTERPVEHIPWSYGGDRVSAAAVDCDRLYVWWETTDQAIDLARGRLGPAGPDAWLNLRVYDSSGILFDGTNAHSSFDHRVGRGDRQWFFQVGKPSSTAFVEIGMRAPDGHFARIARSARVDFPRRVPAAPRQPEWMTVVPGTGERRREAPAPGAAPAPDAPAMGTGPDPGGGEGGAPGFTPIPLWLLREAAEARQGRGVEVGAGGERIEWHRVEGEGWFEVEGRVEWQEAATLTTWQAGPFERPVEIAPPTREEWQGSSFAYKLGGVTHVVFGPWEVVIKNLGAQAGHQVLGRWQVYRSWVAEGGRELLLPVGAAPGAVQRTGASEWVALGASERIWLGASERRAGGASELWRGGASELRLRGASERLLAGASEWMMRGASERVRGGASEHLLRGTSLDDRAGGSEGRLAPSAPPASSAYPALEE